MQTKSAPEKGVVRAEQVARIKAAITLRGITDTALAKKMKRVSRNTIRAHLKGKSSRPITAYYLRKYETALGLPELALDIGTPQDVLALAPIAPLRATGPHQAPVAVTSASPSARQVVHEALMSYERHGLKASADQVWAWLDLLGEGRATGPAGGNAGGRNDAAGGAD